MSSVKERLAALGLSLPKAAAPVANYVPFVRAGSTLVISGQICFGPDGKLAPEHTGKVGAGVTIEAAQAAARLCALNVLAQVEAAVGDLDRGVVQCVRLGGFINASPDFTALPAIMNGASDLLVAILAERGRHARSTVGVAVLPLDAAVEVEALFEVA